MWSRNQSSCVVTSLKRSQSRINTVAHLLMLCVPTTKLIPSRLTFEDVDLIVGNRSVYFAFAIGDVLPMSEQLKMGEKFCKPLANLPNKILTFTNPLSEAADVFAFDLKTETLQITSNGARIKLTSQDVITAIDALKPSIVCLPGEENIPPSKKKGKRSMDSSMSFLNKFKLHSATDDSSNDQFPLSSTKPFGAIPSNLPNDDKYTVAFLNEMATVSPQFYFRSFKELESQRSSFPESLSSVLVDFSDVEDIPFFLNYMSFQVIQNTNSIELYINAALPFRLAHQGKLLLQDWTVINIRDDKYFGDFTEVWAAVSESNWVEYEKSSRFVSETAKHSLSYIHHLLKCEEMLGFQILATINLFTLHQKLVKKDSFSSKRQKVDKQ
jgi:Queuine tRNA-ribosyltransferase